MSTEQDRQIGRTMAILRGDKTQQAVADEMRKRGWRWSQATVWSVEKGERPLRLAEAEDLAAVLGTPSVHAFLTEPIGAYIQQGVRRASNAYRAIVESVWECLDAQDALKGHLMRAREDGHELTEVEQVQRDLWVNASDVPEKAVAEARSEHEQRLRDEGDVDDREGLEWGPDDDDEH
jgi:CRISPR/Cas system-associated exonuclease Cas4 (RecB family)